ncbi:methylosome protein WDR77 [Xylocopa sonorina]|uniref:methylosome protein WDR77 n=1 Tax=Xylocopa sonorina TaxID=1818115 RepID=UPI00403ACDA8
MTSLIQPNLNADVYRNMTAADRPHVFNKHLQCISIYNETSAILGGSNMTDRYWSGTLWYYNDITDFDRNKAHIATRTESGICDIVPIESDKFVLGEDSGALQIFHLVTKSDDLQELQCIGYAALHDNSLLSLSMFHDKEHLVSGGMDCCIKIWDISELMAIQSYGYAHADIINCVQAKPGSDSEFVSVSYCEALLWDKRLSKPAQCILKKDSDLTAVSWNPNLLNTVAIGTDDGRVVIVDARRGGIEVLEESCSFPRPVHKLLFNPDSEGLLAACCDDAAVKVFDINNHLAPVYHDERHCDFVRGLTWFNNNLYSCSWDSRVLKHAVKIWNS